MRVPVIQQNKNSLINPKKINFRLKFEKGEYEMESYAKKGKIENGIIFTVTLMLLIVAIGAYLFYMKPATVQSSFTVGHHICFYLILVYLWLFIASGLISNSRNKNSMKGQLLSLSELRPNLDYQVSWVSSDNSVCKIELDASGKSYSFCSGYEIHALAHSHTLLSFKAGLVFRKRQDGSILFVAPESTR